MQNFRGSYLIGQDVVAALRAELAAVGVEAEVPAVMNDTVATLVGACLAAACGGHLDEAGWQSVVQHLHCNSLSVCMARRAGGGRCGQG